MSATQHICRQRRDEARDQLTTTPHTDEDNEIGSLPLSVIQSTNNQTSSALALMSTSPYRQCPFARHAVHKKAQPRIIEKIGSLTIEPMAFHRPTPKPRTFAHWLNHRPRKFLQA